MINVINILLLNIFPFLVAVVLHEISHGVVAYALGDDTAKRAGRLKLHTHFDLFGSVIIPFALYILHSPILIGYAKPVPVDDRNFKDPELDMALVAIAGPLCNAFLAAVGMLLLKSNLLHSHFTLQLCFNFIASNLALFLFNLIPIPPMDGSRIVSAVVPRGVAEKMRIVEPFGFLIIIGIEIICSQLSAILGYKVGLLAWIETMLRGILKQLLT